MSGGGSLQRFDSRQSKCIYACADMTKRERC